MNDAERKAKTAEQERTNYRLGMLAFIGLFAYMTVWGVGGELAKRCGAPGLLFLVALLVIVVPLGYAAFACVFFLYYICKGEAKSIFTELSTYPNQAKTILWRMYGHGPTLTVLAFALLLSTVYTMFFRYHAYPRDGGAYYLYDRALHRGTLVPAVDCPPSDDEPER